MSQEGLDEAGTWAGQIDLPETWRTRESSNMDACSLPDGAMASTLPWIPDKPTYIVVLCASTWLARGSRCGDRRPTRKGPDTMGSRMIINDAG